MTRATITTERMDELLRFLPVFERPDEELEMPWPEPGDLSLDRVMLIAGPNYPEIVDDFVDLAAQSCWTDYEYTSKGAGEMVSSDEVIARASLEDVKTMLTFFVRGERFCDGHWRAMILNGRIGAILRRLAVLRGL